MSVIILAMNAMEIIIMIAYLAIITMMEHFYKKAQMNA